MEVAEELFFVSQGGTSAAGGKGFSGCVGDFGGGAEAGGYCFGVADGESFARRGGRDLGGGLRPLPLRVCGRRIAKQPFFGRNSEQGWRSGEAGGALAVAVNSK